MRFKYALFQAQVVSRHRQVTRRRDGGSGQFDIPLAGQHRVAARDGLAQAQLAVGGDHHLVRALHRAFQVHAHALFRGDKGNAVGVHAAQGRGVNAHFRFFLGGGGQGGIAGISRGRGGIGQGRHRAVGGHAVFARDHGQAAGAYLGLHMGRARQQGKGVRVVGVDARAFNADVALAHLIAAQRAAGVHLRLARGDGGARHVDEAAAVDRHAVGVGQNHVRRPAVDFDIAFNARAVGAGHLIEDGARLGPTVAVEVGIARHNAAELRIGGPAAVVQDQALLVDVEIMVLVVRQPRAVGRRDVDHRHAVGRGLHARALVGRRIGVRRHTGGPDVGSQYGQKDQLRRKHGAQQDIARFPFPLHDSLP